MARTFDVRIKVEERSKFDLFGLFDKPTILTPAVQKEAAEKYAIAHNMDLVSYRVENSRLIVRVKEKV